MPDIEQQKCFIETYLKGKGAVLEGYLCILTPILSEKPVRFYEHFIYQHIEDSPVINKFIDLDDKRFSDKRIWFEEKHAYLVQQNLLNIWWSAGIGTKSWSVIKVFIDKELISNIYATESLIEGCDWPCGPWPLYTFCPTVFCSEYIFHGIGSRPDITEYEEQIKIWNEKNMGITESIRHNYSKK